MGLSASGIGSGGGSHSLRGFSFRSTPLSEVVDDIVIVESID